MDFGVHWQYKETRLRLMGRCYTFSYARPVGKLDLQSVRMTFLKNTSIYFALHEPEEEFWLSEGLIPATIKFFKFNPKGGKLAAGDVRIVKKTKTVLGSKDSPCLSYKSTNSFTQCVKKRVQMFGEQNVTCITPHTQQYFWTNTSLPWCSGEGEGYFQNINMFVALLLDLGKTPEIYGCMRSCREIAYEASISVYHETSAFWEFGPYLYFAYSTLDVENKEERLLYDFPNLVSAIGGSMGLFLGLSLVNILQKTLQQCCRKKCLALA